MDAAENVSPSSEPVMFIVDTVAPAAPAITSPAEGSTIDTATPVVEGTGELGSTVEVSVDGEAVGTAEVGDGGAWRVGVTTPISEGGHTVSVQLVDDAGNRSQPASNTFAVDIADVPPPGGGDGDGPGDGVGDGPGDGVGDGPGDGVAPGDGADDGAPSDGTGDVGAGVEHDGLATTGVPVGLAALGALLLLTTGFGLMRLSRRHRD